MSGEIAREEIDHHFQQGFYEFMGRAPQNTHSCFWIRRTNGHEKGGILLQTLHSHTYTVIDSRLFILCSCRLS